MLTITSCTKSKTENVQNKIDSPKTETVEVQNTNFIVSDYPSYPKYYKILEKTTYHGEDMEGIIADKWIGLYKNNNGFYIQNTEVYTRTVHDNILDDKGQNTGKEIVINNNNNDNCIVLLGNFDWNFEAPKKVKQIDLTKEFASNESFSFTFLGKNYNWNIKESGCVTVSTKINGKIIEQLVSSSRINGLLFAGDLNSDGELDLILDTAEYDGSAKQLTFFQSLQGDSEMLFELVALHHSTSC